MRALVRLLNFLPLSAFAGYAFATGVPVPVERWNRAFVLGAAAAIVQLAVLLPRPAPMNRLVLGADVYLIVGGVGVLAAQWRLMRMYGALAESGIFASLLVVGVVATLFTRAGYVGVSAGDVRRVRLASAGLLALTLSALGMSIAFRSHLTWSAVVPLMVLALANRVLADRVARPTAPAC